MEIFRFLFAILDKSCTRIFIYGRRSTGFYNIQKPDIASLPSNQRYIRVWCVMDGPNGGWILLQQRNNADFNFYRDWISYEKGFGKPGFGYRLGNSYMHAITLNSRYLLRLELPYRVGAENERAFAEYDNFQVLSPSSGYILRVGKYRGTVIDVVSDLNNHAFSTWDRDNDKVAYRSCAKERRSAWWYGNNCYVFDPSTMWKLIRITFKAKEVLEGNDLHFIATFGKSKPPFQG